MSTAGPIVDMLASLRKARRLSQMDVAAAMGTRQSAVSDIEAGKTEPRLSTLARYAKACGVDLRVTIEASVDVAAVLPERGDGQQESFGS